MLNTLQRRTKTSSKYLGKEKGLAQKPVISNVSFLECYNELTDIIVTTAKDVNETVIFPFMENAVNR